MFVFERLMFVSGHFADDCRRGEPFDNFDNRGLLILTKL